MLLGVGIIVIKQTFLIHLVKSELFAKRLSTSDGVWLGIAVFCSLNWFSFVDGWASIHSRCPVNYVCVWVVFTWCLDKYDMLKVVRILLLCNNNVMFEFDVSMIRCLLLFLFSQSDWSTEYVVYNIHNEDSRKVLIRYILPTLLVSKIYYICGAAILCFKWFIILARIQCDSSLVLFFYDNYCALSCVYFVSIAVLKSNYYYIIVITLTQLYVLWTDLERCDWIIRVISCIYHYSNYLNFFKNIIFIVVSGKVCWKYYGHFKCKCDTCGVLLLFLFCYLFFVYVGLIYIFVYLFIDSPIHNV